MHGDLSVLVLGDIIGHPGMRAVLASLSTLIKRFKSDIVIANAENAYNGFGIDSEIAAKLFHAGVSVITTGNHVWHQKGAEETLTSEDRVLRPDNYPPRAPGKGVLSTSFKGIPVTVINLQGRKNMQPIDCPFRKLQDILKKHSSKIVIIDFHAEDTGEKEGMGYFAAGKASLVFGTHTHVQTADTKILAAHTGYITDVGACCSQDGIIGFEAETSLQMVCEHIPSEFRVLDAPGVICGINAKINTESGACSAIESFSFQSLV